jgi:hypothetical protein
MNGVSNAAEVSFDNDLEHSGILPPARIISECSENETPDQQTEGSVQRKLSNDASRVPSYSTEWRAADRFSRLATTE